MNEPKQPCLPNCIPKYAHDYELFSRWREEPQTVTKYPSVNYNASASGQGAFLANLTSSDRVTDLPFDPSTPLPLEPNLLTIGILGLTSRTKMRDKLVSEIHDQRHALPILSPVDVIVEVDDGTEPTGAKRQKILDECRTEYICFVDDDDWVSKDYLKVLLQALKDKPDCVTFRGIRTTDGKSPESFRFSLHYPNRVWSKDPQGVHMRTPNHLCPIKLELALKVPFKAVNSYEDALWSMHIYPLLHSQCHIDEALYYYRYSSSGSEAAKKEPKLIPERFFELGDDGLFYDTAGKAYAPKVALEILTDLFGTSGPQARIFTSLHPGLFK